MRERSLRRAVRSAALLESVELRRLLTVGFDASFGAGGVAHYSDGLPASSQYDQVVSVSSAAGITSVAEISDLNTPVENQLIVRRFSTSGAALSASTVALPFASSDALTVSDVLVDAGNNTYVAGSRFDAGTNATIGFVVRIDSGGTFDPSFANGSGSISTPELALASQQVHLARAGGTIYAGYAIQGAPGVYDHQILAFDTAGAPSLGYGVAGVSTTTLPLGGASVNELLVDGSGLLLVGTSIALGGDVSDPQSIYISRVDGSGALDTNFATNGYGVTTGTTYANVNLNGVARVGGNFVVSGSNLNGDQFVARLDASYQLDASFDGDGVLPLDPANIILSPLDRSTRSLTADAGGTLYVTGISFGDDSADLSVVALDATGALDTNLDGDGVFTFDEAEGDIGIGIATTPAGAILVTGTQIDGNTGEQSGLFVQLAEPPVLNTPPAVDPVITAGAVNTGVSTGFSSSFSDVDAADTFTVAWDFGDGNTLAAVPTAEGAVVAAHTYAVAGTYTVTVTITDSGGNSVSNTGSITVSVPNATPVVGSVTGPASVDTGVAATFNGSFSDVDLGDTFTVAWDFGDGNTLAPVITAQGAVSATHTYAVAGTYTVTVTISDGVNGAVTSSTSITVTTPPPPLPYTIAAGQLSLTTGNAADTIELVSSGANLVLSVNGTPFTINQSVSSVIISGGGGADFIRVSSQLTLPVTLIGGQGNDTLRGGSGNDVILGDEGNDLVIGRDGQDLMIGGTGADFLIGREDADILISGTTPLSSNLAALAAIQAEWTSNHGLLAKLANITGLLPLSNRLNGNFFLTPNVTVFNDSSVDTLSGGDGSDLYYVTLFGLNADLIRDNLTSFAPSVATLVFGD